MTILIAGTIDMDPNRRSEALQSAQPYIDGALTQPGCLVYAWTEDPVLPARIHVFEKWASQEALATHFENPHYWSMRRHLEQFDITAADVSKYRVDLTEPVYDETGSPRADFVTG